jgi:hypothetical protein
MMKTNRYTYRVALSVSLLAVGGLGGVAAHAQARARAGGKRAEAHTAGTIDLRETATLHLTRSRGMLHEAEGQASGTIQGRMRLRIDVETVSTMSVSFAGSSGSNALAGDGAGRYTISGSTLRFTGTSTITHGAGTYAHASGDGIRFEGILNRVKGTITMAITGQIHT